MAYLLSQLLPESAAKWPEQEAVRFEGQSLTYRQLDEQTNQVARTLWAAGVKPGDRVGIFVHKSFASVVAVFGIMKAGGVYVPLDPNAPPPRLGYIVGNCQIGVLLTATAKLPIVTQFFPAGTIILLDHEPQTGKLQTYPTADGKLQISSTADVLAADASLLPPIPTIETDLAYILYTSGSTGTPKGVMIAHRTIFTFVNWCYDTFRPTPQDRITSHAPLHFDLSTFDIYVTIKAGATLVLVPEKHSVFPVQMVRLFQEERITITYLVPSILSLMVTYGQLANHDLSALRLILFAGEVFPIKYLRQLVHLLPRPDYYNLYGPTETNVCTYYQVRPEDIAPDKSQPVPIGQACENIAVFAVDEAGQLVTEPGREGELWARGSCVAQGYWADPQKTAKGFVPNPFNPHFGEIAYRTGDIVSLAEDKKTWLYIGRRDQMVKSRGYRIELGDIEAVLYSHAAVKEAAIVTIPDELIGNRLKAFVVLHEGHNPTAQELLTYCAQNLPRYMVPEGVTFRPELPKTSTGKINRPELA